MAIVRHLIGDEIVGWRLRCVLLENGIPYCDQEGLYADFHALRHTFISNLVAGGVHPKTAQRVHRKTSSAWESKLVTASVRS